MRRAAERLAEAKDAREVHPGLVEQAGERVARVAIGALLAGPAAAAAVAAIVETAARRIRRRLARRRGARDRRCCRRFRGTAADGRAHAPASQSTNREAARRRWC